MFMIDGITWQKQGPGIYFGRKKVAQNEKKIQYVGFPIQTLWQI